MVFCPVRVPIPRFPCCISPQLPQQTGITRQGTDHSSDHFLRPPWSGDAHCIRKITFCHLCKDPPWFPHTPVQQSELTVSLVERPSGVGIKQTTPGAHAAWDHILAWLPCIGSLWLVTPQGLILASASGK